MSVQNSHIVSANNEIKKQSRDTIKCLGRKIRELSTKGDELLNKNKKLHESKNGILEELVNSKYLNCTLQKQIIALLEEYSQSQSQNQQYCNEIAQLKSCLDKANIQIVKNHDDLEALEKLKTADIENAELKLKLNENLDSLSNSLIKNRNLTENNKKLTYANEQLQQQLQDMILASKEIQDKNGSLLNSLNEANAKISDLEQGNTQNKKLDTALKTNETLKAQNRMLKRQCRQNLEEIETLTQTQDTLATKEKELNTRLEALTIKEEQLNSQLQAFVIKEDQFKNQLEAFTLKEIEYNYRVESYAVKEMQFVIQLESFATKEKELGDRVMAYVAKEEQLTNELKDLAVKVDCLERCNRELEDSNLRNLNCIVKLSEVIKKK